MRTDDERAAVAAERRADRVADEGFGHAWLPRCWSAQAATSRRVGRAARRSAAAARRTTGPSTISTTRSPSRRDVDHREVGVDAVDAADAGQRIGAALDDLALALLGQVLHHHEDVCFAPIARSIAPPTAGIASGAPVCQLARSPVDRHLERAEHADVEVAAAHHREASRRGGRTTPPGSSVTGCLPALMRSESSSPGARRRAHAEHAVLAVQDDLAVLSAGGWRPASAGRCRG